LVPSSQTSPLKSTSSTVLESLPNPAQTVTVLSVSPFDDDHRRLQAIFSHSNWNLSLARSCDEAVDYVRQNHTPIVISEQELAGMCWRSMLRRLHMLDLRPVPRLIVSARLADDQLWSEVLNLGGYNVLEKPFDASEVCWVVSHAWLDWKSERDRTISRVAAAGCAKAG
jgi:DNA-binding response OmpR family regulator